MSPIKLDLKKSHHFPRTFYSPFSIAAICIQLLTLVNERNLDHAKRNSQGRKSESKSQNSNVKSLQKAGIIPEKVGYVQITASDFVREQFKSLQSFMYRYKQNLHFKQIQAITKKGN